MSNAGQTNPPAGPMIMFCNTCGSAITPEQHFCGKCGLPTSAGNMIGGHRVAAHYRTLAILWMIWGGLGALGGLFCYVLGNVMFGINGIAMRAPQPPPFFIRPLLTFIGGFLIIYGIGAVIIGIGLLERAEWVRIPALVMAVIALLKIPIGTALGIYTIWVLSSAGAEEQFRRGYAG